MSNRQARFNVNSANPSTNSCKNVMGLLTWIRNLSTDLNQSLCDFNTDSELNRSPRHFVYSTNLIEWFAKRYIPTNYRTLNVIDVDKQKLRIALYNQNNYYNYEDRLEITTIIFESKCFFLCITECHCNPLGSLAQNCNKQSGQCFCRENVTGRACDKCSDGFWNLESGNGCQSCACNINGSIDTSCNAYTGHCNCKNGVGGLTCDKCIDGYYGFGATGCKRKYMDVFITE